VGVLFGWIDDRFIHETLFRSDNPAPHLKLQALAPESYWIDINLHLHIRRHQIVDPHDDGTWDSWGFFSSAMLSICELLVSRHSSHQGGYTYALVLRTTQIKPPPISSDRAFHFNKVLNFFA
jgi:hypothetical protein